MRHLGGRQEGEGGDPLRAVFLQWREGWSLPALPGDLASAEPCNHGAVGNFPSAHSPANELEPHLRLVLFSLLPWQISCRLGSLYFGENRIHMVLRFYSLKSFSL